MAYDKVTISGNDGKTYVADNAATESTLRELLAVSNVKTGMNARTVRQADSAIGSFTNQLVKSQSKFGYAMQSAAEDVKNFGKVVGPVSKTLVSMFDDSRRGGLDAGRALTYMGDIANKTGNMLGDLLTTGGTAVAGLGVGKGGTWGKIAGLFGLGAIALGDLVKAGGITAEALANVGAKILDLTNDFAQSFNQLGEAGISVDSSFQDLVDSAADGSLNLNELANFAIKNRDNLALLGGSVSSGTRQIMKLSKSIEGSRIQDGFQNLGMQLEDIPEYLAEYSATLRGAGRDLDMTTVAQSALSLAQSQRILSDLTGKSADSLKAEAQARSNATQVQAKLLALDPNARAKYEQQAAIVAQTYGEEGVKAFQDIFANGRATTQATGVFLSQFESAGVVFDTAMNGISDSSIEIVDATKLTFKTVKDLNEQIGSELGVLAGYGQFTQLYGGVLGLMLSEVGTNIAFNQSIRSLTLEEFEKTLAAAETASSSADATLAAIRNINDGTVTLKTEFGKLQEAVVKLAGEPTSNVFNTLADSIGAATDAITETIRSMNTTASASKPEDALGKFLYDTFGTAENTGRTVASGLGGAAGFTIGGAIGSLLGPFGGAVGATGGTLVGSDAATNAYNLLLDFFKGNGGDAPAGYAFGGISAGPKSGYLELLHGTEAVVPLPDGKSIPISTSNNGSSMTELINISSKNYSAMLSLTELSKDMLKQLERNNSLINKQGYANA